MKEEIEKFAQQAWGATQRLGMQIAAMPRNEREAAFKKCEKVLREVLQGSKMPTQQIDGFVELQLGVIRWMVTNIKLGRLFNQSPIYVRNSDDNVRN
jgi:hypothetical protein